MDELKILIQSRKYKRKLVTENFNKKATFGNLSNVDKFKIKSSLLDYQTELKVLNSKIQTLKWSEECTDSLEKELDMCEEYNGKIFECISLLTVTSDLGSAQAQNVSQHTSLKSPIAPLPSYSGKEEEDVNKFFLQFEQTIARFNYSDYDKLLLLKQQLSGRAKILVESLEVTNEGYDQAKLLLEKALASTETKIFNVLSQLSQIKLAPGEEPFTFISKMRNISQGVKTLKIDINHVLQYYFWKGLPPKFQEILVQITNHSKPTFKEIDDNFFEACNRYAALNSKGDSKQTVAGFAADVTNFTRKKIIPCSLCSTLDSKTDHPIYLCKKFSTPQLKLDKLKKLGGCLNCTNLGHEANNCKFRPKYACKHCSAHHLSYLCTKIDSNKSSDSNAFKSDRKKVSKEHSQAKKATKPTVENVESANSSVAETTNGSAITDVTSLNSEFDEHTILPTFSGVINGHKVRILKDGGAQSNFVSEALASELNLKTLKPVTLKVNGINDSRMYDTRLVEVCLSLNSKKYYLQALCLPKININLNLPELERVARTFVKKGYILADTELANSGDRISDVHMILGSKSGFCLPEEELLFGFESPSVYSNTPMGIILKGDLHTLCKNLPHLPENTNNTNSAVLFADSEVAFCNKREGKYIGSSDDVLEEVTALLCTNLDYNVQDLDGNLVESELMRATNDVLNRNCGFYIGSDDEFPPEDNELNKKLVNYVLENYERTEDGRLQLPLLWNPKAAHKLGKNFKLSMKILNSVYCKIKDNPIKLELMENTFKEQEKMGIIEKIEDLDKFVEENPSCSFLPFMGVYKLKRESTKCRVVFLSNLCEKNSKETVISHNQAIHSGPSLNQKLASSILHLRFGKFLLCFDLEKAFNMIRLSENDQNRLLFLWYRNIQEGDFSLVGYKNVRLSFGLRCSPTLLMLSLYIILVKDAEKDSLQKLRHLKRLLYQLAYMDNLAATANTAEELSWIADELEGIFSPYGFNIQQFLTNDMDLQVGLDSKYSKETPNITKLLGLQWNRLDDTLFTHSICLNKDAKTKREILSSIASQYDIFGYNCPILLRSRLFMHDLQCRKDLGWDECLNKHDLKVWGNVANQANASQPISLSRCVGDRSDPYNLIAFSDASQSVYGVVIYLQNVATKRVSFLMAKNRMVSNQMGKQTIPSLELQALVFAAECLEDLYQDLAGESCIFPIKILNLFAYSDSQVALNWIKSYAALDKMQRKSNFVQNRLKEIFELCEHQPITFKFVAGIENPADLVTRPVSYKQLIKTCYVNGPKFLIGGDDSLRFDDSLTVTVPSPSYQDCSYVVTDESLVNTTQVIDWTRHSSANKVFRIMKNVLIFVNKLKSRLQSKFNAKHLSVLPEDHDFYQDAVTFVILHDQKDNFPELFAYFAEKTKKLKDIPPLLNQLNLYQDKFGVIRVKNKLGRVGQTKTKQLVNFPILLSKHSTLSLLLIHNSHLKLAHAGCYTLLNELRKQFWITCMFSLVKKVLRRCIPCQRFHAKPIKLNQSPYREIRLNPDQIPFRNIYIDFMGPFTVKQCNTDTKVWVLVVTCMWSRAINLKICNDLGVREFLMAFQKHCFEYGVPSQCISDLGTQLVAGANVMQSFLNDYEAKEYLSSHGVKSINFKQYFKGHPQLGSLVETCVKLVKRLIFGAIGKNKLSREDFEFIISQTTHLVNRRPIAFKSALRNSADSEVPESITPEKLIKGYELISINMIPYLQDVEHESFDPSSSTTDHVKSAYDQLCRVRHNIVRKYNEEFLVNLIHQAVDKKDRYKPVAHQLIEPGDIVLIKDQFTKPSEYPMAVVKSTIKNVNNEVTDAIVLKGKTREVLKRHSSSLIPLLSLNKETEIDGKAEEISVNKRILPNRRAAIESRKKTKAVLED